MSPEAETQPLGRVTATPPIASERARVSLPWLVRLRWGTVAGQVCAVLVARGTIAIKLPVASIVGAIAMTVLTNVWVVRRLRRDGSAPRGIGGTLLCVDILLLTVVLHLTGGPTNPFSILYLVYITLAAVTLGGRWTWALAGVAVGCYGVLFLTAGSFAHMDPHHAATAEFSLHLEGMWIAFAVAAALIAYFVVQLSAAIERRDAEIVAIREQAARSQRLAALTTLAAGAAHELGTPLATIAVVAKELERALAARPDAAARPLYEDARLIRAELDRCRRILDHLAARSGEASGEAPARVLATDLLDDVLAELPEEDVARIDVSVTGGSGTFAVPRRALVQGLLPLVRNALDATPYGRPIRLSLDATAHRLRLAVRDEGPGMSADVLARAGEPFFTTKPLGRGMGLGLFLARAIAEQMGGRLALESHTGGGSLAAIEIPAGPPGIVHHDDEA